jgi:hypothetical protein
MVVRRVSVVVVLGSSSLSTLIHPLRVVRTAAASTEGRRNFKMISLIRYRSHVQRRVVVPERRVTWRLECSSSLKLMGFIPDKASQRRAICTAIFRRAFEQLSSPPQIVGSDSSCELPIWPVSQGIFVMRRLWIPVSRLW